MDRFFSIVMYLLWIAAIIAVLCATFTNFQYEDVNLLAGILLIFSMINSIFAVVKKK